MADTKITSLQPPQAGYSVVPATDVLPIVVIADPGMATSGSTRKVTVNQLLGAGGTATLASATITGAATVGTTLGVTGVSTFAAGTVSLPALTTTGDTNTGIYYPAADTFAVTTGGTQRILVNSTGLNVGAGIQYAKLTSAGSNATGIANIENSAFASNGNSSLSCYIGHDGTNNRPFIQAATGNAGSAFSLLINPYGGDVSIGNGNVVMGTSGKGIDFSATANSSGTMTSELLNDYEEGTWTPVVADANTGGNTGTCTINSAKYTKIGRVVSVECDISGITTTGMTAGNGLNIRGLPFAPTNGANGNFYTYRVGRNASTVSSSVYAAGSVTALQFYLYTASSGTTDLRILVSDIVSTTSQIIVSVTYTV